MPVPTAFDYAIIRVVPRLDRGERLNAGVVLYCRTASFLAAAIALDRARLLALNPGVDVELIAAHLESVRRICEGGPQAGPIGALTQAERFHWLVAPRSTIIQPSEVHSGTCADPRVALDHLLGSLVSGWG